MEMLFIFLFYYTISFHVLFIPTMTTDTMIVNQTIRDGQTIVSPQETFELGFFSPSNTSNNRYLGIWYKSLANGTVVWVANRETPVRSNTSELTLQPEGVLVLRDSATNQVVWTSTSTSPGITKNPVARLLDSGNFMVSDRHNDLENYIWQSFDYIGDTQIPGMKFGRNLERDVVTNISSWKSVDNPSQGPFMVYMDFNGLPQIFQKNGNVIQHRLGSWNGLAFTGRPSVKRNPLYVLEYVSNENEVYARFTLVNNSVLSKLTLTPEGLMGRFNWINRTQGWILLSTPTSDICARYGLCGMYGSCDSEKSPPCMCLKGFTPKSPNKWDLADWTNGCQREMPLDCGVKEGFRKYSSMKLPDTRQSWFDKNMTLEQCEVKCRTECNCMAYATLDIKYNTGCLLWYNELFDMRTFTQDGQDIYIRLAAAELEKDKRVSTRKKKVIIMIIFVFLGLAVSLRLCLLISMKRKMKLKGKERLGPISQDNDVEDLPLFSLSTILSATNNFSNNNKLGQGGFGPVYKGLLEDGREVAVKRLSQSSTQGVEEFKNEVVFISKLQHRNLVKILGCCIEGEEKMLVYEYMPNKGLDLFLFQETNKQILNWSQRFHIINGIARGLLYLHQDSRLRIIHRDLKAANILLDHEMNPRISDFGLARSFGGNETETNTKRVVGTYGYMSPEYAGNGIFSTKSDVFSFGVLVLEIVSGKKNRRFIDQAHDHNLLGHAWRLYMKGNTLELVEESLVESSDIFEVLRSIHVALLCVQYNPQDRPDMGMVVMMMSSEDRLPEPRQPGYYTEDDKFGPESSFSMQTQVSNNYVTISRMDPR